ncbi:T9SS type B sorting domain-containing protein [Mucilaginibacter ginsenosidivorax]|uniref:Beta-propeller fold lactonase family protein n=1 Tax=Mucilaginibacter ginsenosidivorax TaxID=862126 RepID=A0A5B8VT12_9SPHI|nr:gliding motility-associated C-terminal domain-containing protein [Mucilaginibacter ginsenosidivorax]QEC74784.1 beta-propeller fold lactonase family protein [Mucilaginibacter ginsenosidivorax]
MCKPLLLLILASIFFAPAEKVIAYSQMLHNGQNNIAEAFLTKHNNFKSSGASSGEHGKNNAVLSSFFIDINYDNTFTNVVKNATAKYPKNVKTAFASPNIVTSPAGGTISACVGSPSASTQQFTVSGSNLSGNIMVVAPVGFEVSLNVASGFANLLTIAPTGGLVNSKIIYVRAAAGITVAKLSGYVTLTAAGSATKKVAVEGAIYALPTVDHISDLIFANGDLTTPINFTGTGNTFYWTNDRPGIGLPASGGDNIAPFAIANTGSSPVVAHLSVTSQRANVAYIPNFGSNTVLAVNTITNKIIDTIPVGADPGFVAISPDGKKAYIANISGISLSIINTQTNQVKDISIFDNPTGVIFSKDGARAYVTGASGSCTVIDVANDAVLTALTFPSGGAGLALSNDGKWIYVATFATGDVRVYDTDDNAEIINIPVSGARYAATSMDGGKIYVTGSYSNSVYIIDAATNTLQATISLPTDAEGIAVSPDGSRIYVTNQSAGTVTVIDATNNSIMAALPVGKSPAGISITPDGKYVYVANVDSGTLSIIRTSDYTVTATIPCGPSPHAIGNFITPGVNTCISNPTDFKITVNPSPTAITPGPVGGLITTCIGAPSTSTQQFTVSGNNLSGNITATSPAGLEISFNETSGFADILTIIQSGGAVTNKVVYVRAKALSTPANISGYVTLSTAGAANKNVAVSGVINALPTINTTGNQIYNNGDVTTAITVNGTGNTYTWANDTPSIGLEASGVGDIPSFTAVNAGVAPVKAIITVTPLSAGYLYLTGKNSVIMVNADNNKQAENINTSGQPTGIAVSPDGSLVAITDITFNTVTLINTTTHKVVSTFNNIPSPIGICFSSDGKKVYIANENAFNVSVIDVSTGTVELPIHVGGYPYGIAASADGTTVYVGCIGENAIIAIDTKTRQTTPIKVNFGPTGIAVSPDNSRVYATSAQYKGSLKVVNAATKSVIANVPIGDVSTGICVSPDGKRVYVANTRSNNVMVVDAVINKVIATIPTGNHPIGVSITPDGKFVYVANQDSNSVNIINTADNSISNTISINGQLSTCLGTFFVPGTGCTGTPTRFTITVNGSPAITVGATTGSISACIGSPSTHTQQFTVSGSNLSGDITVKAPSKFEVSLNPNNGFANSVIIVQTSGKVTNRVVYVRAAASDLAGNISDNVILYSVGLPDMQVAANGVIQALPIVNQITDQSFNNGETTNAISFTGTASTYTWTNDSPSIGLPANGSGNIPAFTAINNGKTVLTAIITVIPSDPSCSGNSITFKININPPTPSLITGSLTGNITACQGSPSVSPNIQQFTVAGTFLTGNVQITAPAKFEVSLSPNSGFANSIVIVQTNGTVTNKVVYVRAIASSQPGNFSDNVILSSAGVQDKQVAVNGVIHALPVVNQVTDQSFNNGETTNAISFTGTATTYAWTNDSPSIGLPATGSGDIPAFTAINNGQTVLTAIITVIPSDASCTGNAITFKININPPIPSLTISPLTGSITACQGSPSASRNVEQFTVTGTYLSGDIQITVPVDFEISVNPNVGYANKLTLVQTSGKVSSTIIYVRSSVIASVGNISGLITISSVGASSQTANVTGTINALPVVNQISPLIFNNGTATTAINFRGTAATYTWTNDTPGIGLQASGTGDIPTFTAVNNLTTAITAIVIVTPSNGPCTGPPVIFKITVNPTPAPAITAVSNLSPLSTIYGRVSASGTFDVSGDNLVSAITITPPTGFEVSNDGINFKNTAIIGGPGTLITTTVYIRLAKTTIVGNYAGNIILTSNGLTNNLIMPNSTVLPASMTVTADNKTRPFQSKNPPLTITYGGFVNNENEFNLIKKPEVQTIATFASAVGEYAISFTGKAESPNYSFTYVPGVLTITSTAVVVVNTFTPNGDGTNDTWAIKHIESYPNCIVNVFNRLGAKVFSSIGYGEQWDGKSGGGPVPVGTYYYTINLNDGSPVKAGWVAIIR